MIRPDALPCFRDQGSHTSSDTATSKSSTSSKSVQNLVTCLYRATIAGQSRIVLVTWIKSLMGLGLSVTFDYPACKHRCSVDMKPWRFWKKQGSKSIAMCSKKMEMFWDLSSAKYESGAEPREGFYVAIACEDEAVLLLGDMHNDALKKLRGQAPPSDTTLISRKEHVYGKQLYTTKAQLRESGRAHDIAIECHVDAEKDSSRLSVRVDKQTVIHVTSLMWKFRGNQTIQIDGRAVEVYWDVHNWLFEAENGHGVFMFNTYVKQEKRQSAETGVAPSTNPDKPEPVSDALWASVLRWPTCTDSRRKEEGFSLVLYAWNNE